MPLNKSCSLDALRENISAGIREGKPRDQAVATAHSVLKSACSEEGKPVPTAKDVAGVAREFKRARGERSHDYLEEALAAARAALPHRDFAVIHQAARSKAGGKISARNRMSPIEKSLLLGPTQLTAQELWDAVARADEMAAADMRRGLDIGGAALAQLLQFEAMRRDYLAKSDPGPSDVHVSTTEQGKPKKKPKAEAYTLEPIAKADRSEDPGVMIAFRLPLATANAIALEGGEPPERLHVTLAYMGRMSVVGPEGLKLICEAVRRAVYEQPVLKGNLAGIGRFAGTESSDGKDVVIALVDVPGLSEFRRKLCDRLCEWGMSANAAHDYTPHVTLAYVDASAPTPKLKDNLRLRDVYFDKVVVAVNDADVPFELGGEDALRDAKMAALAAQAREAGGSAVPSAPMYIESVSYPSAVLMSADGMELEAALKMDADFEPGDLVEVSCDMSGAHVVEGPSAATLPADFETVQKALEDSLDARRHQTSVPFIGPENARLVFVSGAPSELELARMEPMVGPNGVVFAERYLAPLGVTKSEVAIGFACPVLPRVADDEISSKETGAWKEYVAKEIGRWPDAVVVALGLPAREALGDRANFWLPHPTAARLNEARYEEQVGRKLRQVAKALDGTDPIGETSVHRVARPDGTTPEILAGRIGETLAAGPSTALMRVAKAADEMQIVYGVVLDPYEIDTQGEWVPPATVRATAQDYVKKSRVIGREHRKPANAEMVESWLVEYPSLADEKAAYAGLPHKAYERPFGEDTVKSGAWIMGVQLGDAEWADYKSGKITGFSIGGFSSKTRVSKSAMPEVEFIPFMPAK